MPEALTLTPALPYPPLRAPDGSLTLAALPGGRLIHALARPGTDAASLAPLLKALGDGSPHAVRPYAPGQWFILGPEPLRPGEWARLTTEAGASLALSDQSHGRVRLWLDGPRARGALARGTGVDLGETVFTPGTSAATLFGHIGIHLTCLALERFELIVLRGFAESLWHELAKGSAIHRR